MSTTVQVSLRPTQFVQSRSNDGREDLAMPSKNLEVQADETYHWGWYTTPQAGVNNRSIEYNSGHVLGGGTSMSKLSGSGFVYFAD